MVDEMFGYMALAFGFLLVVVIAFHAGQGLAPRWARSLWLTILAAALFAISWVWYGWEVLYGP